MKIFLAYHSFMDKVIFPTITHTNSRRCTRGNKMKLLYFIYSNIYYRFSTYTIYIHTQTHTHVLKVWIWYAWLIHWIPKNLVYSKIVCDYKIRARLYDYGLEVSYVCNDIFARLYSSWEKYSIFTDAICAVIIIIQILFVNEKLTIS